MVTAVLEVTAEEEEAMVVVGMAVAGMVVAVVEVDMEAAVAVVEVVVAAALAVDEVALLAEAAKFVIRVAVCENFSPASMLRIAGWQMKTFAKPNQDQCMQIANAHC